MNEPENSSQTTSAENNEPATPAPPLSPVWLWIARIAAGLPLLSLVAILVYEVASKPSQLGALSLLLPILIFSLPYLQILNTLRGEVQKHRVGLAVAWSALMTLFAALILLLLFRQEPELSYWSAVMHFGAAFALVQPLLLLSTTVLYFKLERRKLAKRERIAAAGSLIYYGILFLNLVFTLPVPGPRMFVEEASAIAQVRVLVSCTFSYQAGHPEIGFPVNVTGMGPISGDGDGCIDSVLLKAATPEGEPRSGYRFTYTPGEPNEEGIIYTFTITAVPSRCGRTGVRSYYADETGVVRFTNDQAAGCPAANANSPPLS